MKEGKPSWERVAAWLLVGAVSLQIVAALLPRVLGPLVVVALTVCAVRLVWWFTQI